MAVLVGALAARNFSSYRLLLLGLGGTAGQQAEGLANRLFRGIAIMSRRGMPSRKSPDGAAKISATVLCQFMRRRSLP